MIKIWTKLKKIMNKPEVKSKPEHPYADLSMKAFWRTAIADQPPNNLISFWNPKFNIQKKDSIVTFGSCFAQNIGRELCARGYNWHIEERLPQSINSDIRRHYNYDSFSVRTGNIYTTSLLRQWLSWALNNSTMSQEVWTDGCRFFDPFRPRIAPNGFESEVEMLQSRKVTLSKLLTCIKSADIFVFTLGLTECWRNTDGYEYPMCPGTVEGSFDSSRHFFKNLDYHEVFAGLESSIAMIRSINANVKVLLTVSPVPLTATMSGKHVLEATTYSKSILRAVVGDLASSSDYIDYFPSYELANWPCARRNIFNENLRTVSSSGVSFIMDHFFSGIGDDAISNMGEDSKFIVRSPVEGDNGEECDDALLEAFSKDLK